MLVPWVCLCGDEVAVWVKVVLATRVEKCSISATDVTDPHGMLHPSVREAGQKFCQDAGHRYLGQVIEDHNVRPGRAKLWDGNSISTWAYLTTNCHN